MVSGWMKKKMSAEIRWLGPYAPEDRHCDKTTMDHLIGLQKKLAEAETQRDNALNACMMLRKEIRTLIVRLEKYGDFTDEEERNC